MKCLKTGLFIKIDHDFYFCDMFFDQLSDLLVFKGFGKKVDFIKYHVPDIEINTIDNSIISSEKFKNWMEKINPKYDNWYSKSWIILSDG